MSAFYKDGRLRQKHVMLEPVHERISATLVDPNLGRVKPNMYGKIIKVGKGCNEVVPGMEVVFVPHGGTLLDVPEGHAERMVVPVSQVHIIVEA